MTMPTHTQFNTASPKIALVLFVRVQSAEKLSPLPPDLDKLLSSASVNESSHSLTTLVKVEINVNY